MKFRFVPQIQKYVSVSTAAELVSYSKGYIRSLAKKGVLVHKKSDRSYLILETTIVAYGKSKNRLKQRGSILNLFERITLVSSFAVILIIFSFNSLAVFSSPKREALNVIPLKFEMASLSFEGFDNILKTFTPTQSVRPTPVVVPKVENKKVTPAQPTQQAKPQVQAPVVNPKNSNIVLPKTVQTVQTTSVQNSLISTNNLISNISPQIIYRSVENNSGMFSALNSAIDKVRSDVTAGVLAGPLPTTLSTLTISGASGSAGCATFSATGLLSNTGSPCASGGGTGTDKFATSTNGLTIYPNSATSLVIGGTATTTTGAKLEVLGSLYINASSTLQNFTGLQSTSTNSTSTNFFATTASSTNLFASIVRFTNLLLTSSTTLQNFTGIFSTTTNSTSTNFFATTLFSTTHYNSGLGTFGNLLSLGSSTLQAFTGTTSTTTNSTSTGAFSVGTNLVATGGLSTFSNTLHTGSTTLQSFTGTTSTTTNATSSNLYISGTASTTNLFATSISGAFTAGTVPASLMTAGTFGSVAGTGYAFPGTLSVTSGLLTVGNLLHTGSTTLQNFTGLLATTTNATSTGALSVGSFLTATGALSTFSNTLHTSSTTLQNFTFAFATGTSATTTNFFATTASTTNFFTSSIAVGTTSPWKTLSVVGTMSIAGLETSTAGNAVCITTSNGVVTAGNTTCTTSSLKTKHNVVSISGEENVIMNLRPVSYINNEGGDARYGFIAEEVAQLDTKIVQYAKSDVKFTDGQIVRKGEPISVDYERYVALLTKFVQGQQTQINELKNSSGATLSTGAVSNWLISLGVTIENNVAHFVEIIVDSIKVKKLNVGDSTNPSISGITILDRITGQPYCMYIENGNMKSQSGECGQPVLLTPPPVVPPPVVPPPVVEVPPTEEIVTPPAIDSSTPQVETPATPAP